jgi:hypothetical protein
LIENKVGRDRFHPEGAMPNWGVLILVTMVFVANLPAVMQQWRTDRPGFIKTLWLMGVYAVYVALGICLFLLIAPPPGEAEPKALLLTIVVVGWILYGVLTLMRVVPRYREPRRWLMRFGIADVVLLGLMFGCLLAYLA